MTGRRLKRWVKIEAVRLATDRGVAVAQAAPDLGLAESRSCRRMAVGCKRDHLFHEPASKCGRLAMESFFLLPRTERAARKICRTRDMAPANVFDYTKHR